MTMEPKKISRRLILKENHSTAIKVSKLMDLADELGISFSFSGQRVLLQDSDRDPNLPNLFVEDIEDNHWFEEFPFVTEYRLVYDNPAYLAQQKAEQEEYQKAEDEKVRLKYERAKAKKQEEERLRAEAIERAEREQLATLKTKYGE